MSSTTVLARKWRPKTFAQLAGQDHVVRALSNALTQQRLHHAYLFSGTRGVGKTTIARIFAKSLNCEKGITPTPCGVCNACKEIDSGRFVDLIELDAASNTQVDNMRELLESALYAPSSGRYKVYIIDEVHMLSKSAFNAMLKTLEEPPGHVKFILATTDPQKVPVTVLSRCLQFNLKQIPPAMIASHLNHILEQEKIYFEPGALRLISRAAQGSMRDALSLLDQAIAYSAGKVEEAMVHDMLGAIDQGYLFDLLVALSEHDGAKLLEIADNLAERSIALDIALQEMATLLHRISLAQVVPQSVADDYPERARLFEIVNRLSAEELQLFYQIAIHGRDEFELAPDEYAGFTMTLLRMLAFMPAKTADPHIESGLPAKVKHAKVSDKTAEVSRVSTVLEDVPKEKGISANETLEWSVLLSKLSLQGMAQQMAKHCVLKNFSDGQITLLLSPEHKHFQTSKSATEKLQAALCDYFAKPIKVNVTLGKAETATPAVIEHKGRQAQQELANEAIAQDSFVRDAQAEFSATLVPESIKPIQKS